MSSFQFKSPQFSEIFLLTELILQLDPIVKKMSRF